MTSSTSWLSRPSLLEDLTSREKRELIDRGLLIATTISKLSGVLSASAILTPVETGTRLHPTRQLRVTVIVQAVSGQTLPGQTVQLIRVAVSSLVSQLEPNGLTLIDPWSGRIYAVAGRPEAEVLSAAKAREEEVHDKILDQLRIEGARVTVRIDPPRRPPQPRHPRPRPSPSIPRSAGPRRPRPTTAPRRDGPRCDSGPHPEGLSRQPL